MIICKIEFQKLQFLKFSFHKINSNESAILFVYRVAWDWCIQLGRSVFKLIDDID